MITLKGGRITVTKSLEEIGGKLRVKAVKTKRSNVTCKYRCSWRPSTRALLLPMEPQTAGLS